MREVRLAGEVVVAVGAATEIASDAESRLERATFTLTDAECDDRRVITVASVPDVLVKLTERCQRWPQATAVCDDVLRSVDPAGRHAPA